TYDLCFIQEPHIDFLNNTRAPPGWRTIYPPRHRTGNDHTRAITLISPKLNTSHWKDLCIDSPDITGIEIWGPFGTVTLINIYNDCTHSGNIETLTKWMNAPATASHPPTELSDQPGPRHTIWLGDFNRHHPIWESEENHHLFTREALTL